MAPFVSGAVARMQKVLESTIASNVTRSSSPLPPSPRAFPHCEVHSDGPLVTFQRSLTWSASRRRPASLAPRCWWEMREFVRCAFRFCRCVGSLHGLSVTSSSVQRNFLVHVATFNHFSLSLCSTRRHICVLVPQTGTRNSQSCSHVFNW